MWVCFLLSELPYKCFELRMQWIYEGGVDFDLHVCIFFLWFSVKSLSGGFYVFYAYFNISVQLLLCPSFDYNITL